MANEKEKKSGGGKAAAILGGLVLLALGVWFALSLIKTEPGAGDRAARTLADSTVGKAVKAALVPEEERMAYIAKSVTVSDLKIEGDHKPGEDGGTLRIGGLLRVTGKVINNGDRPVKPVNMILTTFGETNEVLGSYVESLTGDRTLEPGASHEFKFEIPEKPGFQGRYDQKLR